MSGFDRLIREVARIARREARQVSPPVEQFRVKRRKPLTLESLSSDTVLTDGDEDFEVARGVRQHAQVGSVVWVSETPSGNRYAHGVSSPHVGNNADGSGGGADEAEEAAEAEGGAVAAALAAALKDSGIGMVIGPGPRDPDFPYAHAVYVSVEEPVDYEEYDQWIKPE